MVAEKPAPAPVTPPVERVQEPARTPDPRELNVLQRIYEAQLAKYQADAAAAAALVKNGTAAVNEQLPAAELAAWMAVSNVLLNLDETITRE